jgi:hypothetical protein
MCSFEGCDRPTVSLGLCNPHYLQGRRTGVLKPLVFRRAPVDRRFWSKVQKGPDCWTWAGSRSAKGYGRLNVGGAVCQAHRVSWELHRGAIPSDLFVLHRCDNPPCVNPDHLFLGTALDNSRDMVSKGRQKFPKGHLGKTFPCRHLPVLAKLPRSGHRGVRKNGSGWMANVTINGKTIYLGTFRDLDVASLVADEARWLRSQPRSQVAIRGKRATIAVHPV